MIELMVTYSLTMLGVHYSWGGDNRLEGFDCSGFVQECLASIGKDKKGDQTAQYLYDYFSSRHMFNSGLAERGNLLFFGKHSKDIGHIAIALDEDHLIEAAGGGRLCRTIEDAKRLGACVRIRPIRYRSDLVGIIDFTK